jgi:CRP-like cAMP-binding protein
MSDSNAQQSDLHAPEETYRCRDLLKQHLCVGGTIFDGLSEQELQQADQYLHPLSIAAGDQLYKQGDPGDALIYIVKGRVQAETDGKQHGEIGAGTIVGEMAPFIHQPRSASVTAVEDCELLVLSAKDFASLRKANHILAW